MLFRSTVNTVRSVLLSNEQNLLMKATISIKYGPTYFITLAANYREKIDTSLILDAKYVS